MGELLPNAVCLLGPFALAYLGRRFLHVPYPVFGIGMLAFCVAWVTINLIVHASQAASNHLAAGTFLYSLLVGATAGLFEESSRYFSFRFFSVLKKHTDWKTGIMYAIGHSGLESIVVGALTIIAVIVVQYFPEGLSTEKLSQARAALQVGFLVSLYRCCERLFVGLLIHSCFTLVVLLGLLRGQKRYLLLAMFRHCGHDLVGLNLFRLSDYGHVDLLWIVFIVIVYSGLLILLIKKTSLSTQGGGSSSTVGS